MIVIRRIIQYKVILIPLFILLGVSAVRVNDPDLLASFRNQVFDAYQVAVPRESANKSVSVGAIDEKSLRKLGQWPWPRVLFSDILKKLREKGSPFSGKPYPSRGFAWDEEKTRLFFFSFPKGNGQVFVAQKEMVKFLLRKRKWSSFCCATPFSGWRETIPDDGQQS